MTDLPIRASRIALAATLGAMLLATGACNSLTGNRTSDNTFDATDTGTGYVALQRGDAAKAAEYYEEALKAKPDDPYYNLNLATAYQKQGRMDQAAPLYNKVIAEGRNEVPDVTTQDWARNKTLAEIACTNMAIGYGRAPSQEECRAGMIDPNQTAVAPGVPVATLAPVD